MLEIIEERRKERKELIKRANEFLKKSRRFGKISVILYGSVARGDFNVWSDVDVILIAENLPKDLLKRQELLHSFKIPKVEPKGYRLDEFLGMVKLKHPFIEVLAKEGIFLIDEFGLKKKLGYRKL